MLDLATVFLELLIAMGGSLAADQTRVPPASDSLVAAVGRPAVGGTGAEAAWRSAQGRALEPHGTSPVEAVLRFWPKKPRTVARAIMKKYGAPNRVSGDALVWNNNGPWKRTVVHRSGEFRDFPQGRMGVLEQFVSFSLPLDKIMLLERVPAGLEWNHDLRELSASGESEESNFLALNVADGLIAGRLSVGQARNLLVQATAARKGGRAYYYEKGLFLESR